MRNNGADKRPGGAVLALADCAKGISVRTRLR